MSTGADVISKVGFFRFVAGYDRPMESLDRAFQQTSDVANALVVLPEAFNIGKYYRDGGQCDYNGSALQTLQSVAAERSVTFIAGMIVEEANGPMPPFSSAFLIDVSGSKLICRKHGDDGYMDYTPFSGAPDASNPVQCGRVSIAAILCMDCVDPQIIQPIEALLSEAQGPKIVCIPACMNNVYRDEAIAELWPNHHVVLANSDPLGCPNFISKDGTIIMRDNRGMENAIVLSSL